MSNLYISKGVRSVSFGMESRVFLSLDGVVDGCTLTQVKQ